MSEQNLLANTGEIFSEDATVTVGSLTEPGETLQEPTPPKKKPKKRIFWICFLIYAVVLCIAGGAVLVWLNSTLTAYEATTPGAALEQYATWVREKNYQAIFEHAEFETDIINTKEEHIKYLSRVYAYDNQQITFRERVSLKEDEKLYSVYFNDVRVGIVSLTSRTLDGNVRWQVKPQLVFQKDYTLVCDGNARLTVNGNDIALLGFTPEEIQSTVFAGLKDPTLYPALYRYTLSGLLNEPEVSALSLNGTPCTVSKDDHNILVTHTYTAKEIEEQKALAQKAATTYAKFVAKDATKNQIQALIYKESDLYQAIRDFYNGWFSTHEDYEFRDMEIKNYCNYTDIDFTCEVKFQPVYIRKGKEFNGEIAHYRITALKINDEWKIISMPTILDTDNNNSDTAAD